MKALTMLMFVVILFVVSQVLVAEQEGTTIQRLGEGDMPIFKTKLKFTTLIILPPGEEVVEVTCGDTELWVVEGREGNVNIKPSKEGAMTNINILTKNKLTYSFLVQEISKPGSREKPDLRIHLGSDGFKKTGQGTEAPDVPLIKAERGGGAPAPAIASWRSLKLNAASTVVSTNEPAPNVPPPSAAPVETPGPGEVIDSVTALKFAEPPAPPKKHSGLLRWAGRSFWGALRRINRVFSAY